MLKEGETSTPWIFVSVVGSLIRVAGDAEEKGDESEIEGEGAY